MEITWSDKIKTLESRDWSLKQLSEVTGLSPQSLSDIKTARTTEPRGMAAVKLHTIYTSGMRPSGADARTANGSESSS